MKKMTITLAFLIALLVILWFFGVTLFYSSERAQYRDSLPASIYDAAPAAEPVPRDY